VGRGGGRDGLLNKLIVGLLVGCRGGAGVEKLVYRLRRENRIPRFVWR